MKTRMMIGHIALFVGVLGLSGCSWIQEQTGAGETTTVSAVTGGALGAGLGAIVGSQTGDAGTGLVIGGLAGTAAGAAIGDVLEGQENAIRTQDEAIERQERVIRAQSEELQELRRGRSDLSQVETGRLGGADVRASSRTLETPQARFSDMPQEGRGSAQGSSYREPQYQASRGLGSTLGGPTAREYEGSQGVNSRDITPRSDEYANARAGYTDRFEERTAYDPSSAAVSDTTSAESASSARLKMAEENLQRTPEDREPLPMGSAAALPGNSSSECVQAEGEFRTALRSDEPPEQLFHLRRALRLCPDRAEFHNALGEVYVKLNRDSDATFEFGEALRLNPALDAARSNLREVQARMAGSGDTLAAQRY